MEAILAGGLAVLGTKVAGGVSIKDIVPTMLSFSWKLFLTYKKKALKNKLAKMIITYIEKKYPHKKLLKEMKVKVNAWFKRHTKVDLINTIQYFKEIKELFYAVNFNCAYWEQHQKELLLNPEKLRDFMVKKIYIERLKDIIVVKLYNNILSKEDMSELERDLMDTYLVDTMTVDMLDKIVSAVEKEMVIQYNANKSQYDKDFLMEQNALQEIFEKAKSTISRAGKSAMYITQEIIKDCRNEVGSNDNYTKKSSEFLKNTRSLTKSTSSSSIEETNNNNNSILEMLN